MINVEKALQILDKNSIELPSESKDVRDSLHHVLMDNIISPVNLPAFNQSAMDGFAVNYDPKITTYKIVGEVPAGSPANPILKVGEAVRIYTGAMVPSSANTVVQIEWVNISNNEASFNQEIKVGINIRPIGEQIKKGDVALRAGTVITPAGVGFLIGLGIEQVEVVRKPKISIISTGNELVKLGQKLELGQVYESNSYMLAAALDHYHYSNYSIDSIKDDYDSTKSLLKEAIENSDLVMVTGGISVGDYDFVGKALNELGVEQLFYKVNQRPGKPLYAGKHKQTMIMALPGNPAAALSCFYIYVLHVLNQMSGLETVGLDSYKMPISEVFENKTGKSLFLKGKIKDGEVIVLDKQSSAMLASFAQADVLIYLPEDKKNVRKLDFVTVYKF